MARVGSTADFLGLSGVEEALVDMKLTLGMRLRKTREQHKLTQIDLAKRMGSSQSRSREKWKQGGSGRVPLDLLVQGLLAAGATRRERLRPHSARARRRHAHNVPVFSCEGQREREARAPAFVSCNTLLGSSRGTTLGRLSR